MEPIYIVLICIGSVLLISAVALFFYLSNNLLHTSFYEVKSPKIERGLKIIQLSDLHGKSFGKGNVKLLNKVNELSPDIIVITGDIIHKYRDSDIKVALNLVEELVKIAPVYYVSGNHEMRNKRYRVLKERIALAGACVAEGKVIDVNGVTLCGVNCADIKGGKFFHILGEGDDGFKLLLAHLPQYIQKYALAGFDCVLCGHAHGGQWRIPFTNIGLFAPGQGLLPEYTSGVYTCGDMKEIVSRGLGNSQFPLRLFNRPEIVVVELKGNS